MKTKITLLFTTTFLALLFSWVGNAQNTIEIDHADTQISSDFKSVFSVSYTKSGSDKVHIQARLMTTSGKVVIENSTGVPVRPGLMLFEFKIPNLPIGGVYKWHVQMYSSNWKQKLAEHYYEDLVKVTERRAPPSNNTFSNFSPPTRITAGATQNISYNFTKTEDGKVHIQTRLLSKEGGIILQDTQSSEDRSGLISVQFKIPFNLSARSDYKWNIQMFNSDWKNKLATITKSGIRISSATRALKVSSFNESDSSKNQDLNDFMVSPNPFINSFVYTYNVLNYDDVTVELYALNGRKIETLKDKESHRPGNYSDVVDTGNLDEGIYILRINTSEGEKALKLIKN